MVTSGSTVKWVRRKSEKTIHYFHLPPQCEVIYFSFSGHSSLQKWSQADGEAAAWAKCVLMLSALRSTWSKEERWFVVFLFIKFDGWIVPEHFYLSIIQNHPSLLVSIKEHVSAVV